MHLTLFVKSSFMNTSIVKNILTFVFEIITRDQLLFKRSNTKQKIKDAYNKR